MPVSPNGEKITIREINELRRKMQKYKNMVKILQSVDCTVSSPTKDKLRALESFYGQYEVHKMCIRDSHIAWSICCSVFGRKNDAKIFHIG